MRFVVGPERRLVLDLEERLPGRGIWLSAGRDVLENAGASPRLARAAGGRVTVPADLLVRVEVGLVQRLTELLSAARRARRAALHEQAHVWLAQKCAALWLEAEGSGVAEAGLAEGTASPVFACVPAAVLDAAFAGRGAGPVALRGGRVAEAVRVAAVRHTLVRGLVRAAQGQAVA